MQSTRDCWQQTLQQAIKSPHQLLKQLAITPEQLPEPLADSGFPMLVPQPYVDLMQQGDANDPLLKQVLPTAQELVQRLGYSDDPLEEQQPVVPGMMRKYRNRVLIMLRTGCAINCRYCFRRHFPYADNSAMPHLAEIIDYLMQHPEIDEVIFSGGDPLMATDAQLARVIAKLEAIPHLKRLRIHSRLPVVLPSRLTDSLAHLLGHSRLLPILVLHTNHANEVGAQLAEGVKRLSDVGVRLFNQGVLLKGVNDSVDAQVALCYALFEAGIQPYYLFTLDKVQGAAHFDLPLSHAREIAEGMLQRLPGYMVPKLVAELPKRDYKVPLDLLLS